jgi:hypothetical protein
VEQGVFVVMSASPNLEVRWSAFFLRDLPVLSVEQGGNISGRNVVGRVATVSLGSFDVNHGMVNHQEMPAGADGGQKGMLGIRGRSLEKCWIMRRDETETARECAASRSPEWTQSTRKPTVSADAAARSKATREDFECGVRTTSPLTRR